MVGGGTFWGRESVDLGTINPVDVTVRVYPSAFDSYEEFSVSGASFSEDGCEFFEPITFSAQGGNSNTTPPEIPRALGFPSGVTTIVCPEPSTIVLGILGLALLGIGRRHSD